MSRLRPIPSVTDPHTLRRIAVAADVDPRTVAAYLAGLPVRPTIGARLARAVADLGLANLVARSSVANAAKKVKG